MGERPPAPLPPVPSGDGSCTHRSPLSPAPGVQPRGLGPAAKRVSGPVSQAGLRDARAARAINNQPPGGSGGFPVTPGRGAGGGGRKETMKPPAALLPGRPGSFSPRSPVPAPARPARSRARVWEGPRRACVPRARQETRGLGPIALPRGGRAAAYTPGNGPGEGTWRRV